MTVHSYRSSSWESQLLSGERPLPDRSDTSKRMKPNVIFIVADDLGTNLLFAYFEISISSLSVSYAYRRI